MNNWNTPIRVEVRLLTDLLIPQVPHYDTYDADTKVMIDRTMPCLQDHMDNVPMEADSFTYKCGIILYEVSREGSNSMRYEEVINELANILVEEDISFKKLISDLVAEIRIAESDPDR